MRREGETQVLVTEMHTKESNPSISVPIEAGARGELIAINSVRYTPPSPIAIHHWILLTALSTNPEHEETPPASIPEFMESHALYAKSMLTARGPVAVTEYQTRSETVHVNLYGLLRPRRQIWVMYAVAITTGSAEVWIGLELNYIPVKVDDVTLNEYNHRYGLYKRA